MKQNSKCVIDNANDHNLLGSHSIMIVRRRDRWKKNENDDEVSYFWSSSIRRRGWKWIRGRAWWRALQSSKSFHHCSPDNQTSLAITVQKYIHSHEFGRFFLNFCLFSNRGGRRRSVFVNIIKVLYFSRETATMIFYWSSRLLLLLLLLLWYYISSCM